jgi:hypothetical protein
MSEKRGRPFQPGNKCGRGRPRGSRNKKTIQWQEMLSEHGAALLKKCVLMAMQGDSAAMRLCMERLLPPCKQSPAQFPLPMITTVAELVQAQAAVLEGFSRGELTGSHAETMSELLDKFRHSLETEQLEARLRALEQRGRGIEHES